MIRKLFSLFFLQAVLIILFCSSCAGFFINSTQERSAVKKITPKTDTLPTTFSYYLVWFDNEIFYSLPKDSKIELVIQPQNSVTAFYMPILEFVTHQKWSYLPSDFSIEDLLYANLKLNRLVQEYNSLKGRSAEILKGLEVPYMDHPSGFEPLMSENNGTLSLQLDAVSNQIRQLTGPVISTPKIVDLNNHKQSLPSEKRTPLHTVRQPLNSSSDPSLGNSQSFSHLNRVGPEPESDQPAIQENNQYSNRLNDSLPWIERIAVSIINYFKTNKIELIICLTLLFGIYQMLFRIRKD